MKLRFFGKEAEIKTEAVVIGVSVLVLLGILIGYVFFRDTGDIIIEADRDGSAGSTAASDDAGNISAADKLGSGAGSGSNITGNATSVVSNAGGSNAGGSTLADNSPRGGLTDGNASDTSDNDKGRIKVYVVGCVSKPGIVTLEKGSMICDAVKEAGGLTEEADPDNINMVYSLNENVMLYIKSKKEENDGLGNGAVVISHSGAGAEVIGEGDDPGGGDRIVPVNINTAGIDELDTLPGVGEATARDIIAYRDKYGGFSTVEDIMRVPRIKENRFESIRDYITVE
ncbi:MAG: hypothetical protein GX279_13520 [Clostridiaceae bacterium]|nr:hypothetical protein [Clostridiaceae bacterium]